MSDKLTKAQACYLPAKLVRRDGGVGTVCGECRDFIQISSECILVDDPSVDEHHATCAYYINGTPHPYGKPLRLIPKAVAGYLVHIHAVPTYCGKCEYYARPGARSAECAKVEGEVEYGGCCAVYEYKGPQR